GRDRTRRDVGRRPHEPLPLPGAARALPLRRLHRRPLMDERVDERARRRVLVAVMLAIFLAAIESTVVALAMPTVVASLGGLHVYSWVFSGYLLTQTVTMPLWGRFSDLYGRRAVYLVGLATFLAGSALSGEPRLGRRTALDWWGVASFTTGVALVMLALAEAGREASWSSGGVLGLLAAGAVALVAFAAVERRVAEPIVPLGLFASRMLVAAVLTRSLAAMAMFGALAFVPLFVQSVTGASATRSGAVLVPFVLGWVALSALSARLVLRVGYRGVVMTGVACLTGSFLLLARWDAGLGLAGAMRDVLLAGVGMGLVIVPLLIAVQ